MQANSTPFMVYNSHELHQLWCKINKHTTIYDKIFMGEGMNINRLREIREDRNYSQRDIARVLHVPQQNYSRYELGIVRMPIEKYVILAKFYRVSVDYLIGLTDEIKPYPKSII